MAQHIVFYSAVIVKENAGCTVQFYAYNTLTDIKQFRLFEHAVTHLQENGYKKLGDSRFWIK